MLNSWTNEELLTVQLHNITTSKSQELRNSEQEQKVSSAPRGALSGKKELLSYLRDNCWADIKCWAYAGIYE